MYQKDFALNDVKVFPQTLPLERNEDLRKKNIFDCLGPLPNVWKVMLS